MLGVHGHQWTGTDLGAQAFPGGRASAAPCCACRRCVCRWGAGSGNKEAAAASREERFCEAADGAGWLPG